MDMIVPRTVTAVGSDDKPARTGAKLSDFRDERFYVLLGSPGAGKTTAFKAEAERDDASLFVRARDVVRSPARPRSDWHGKTLFIDGLDEVRAGKQDMREPLDSILDCLDRLGAPPARLSCRSAAWLATNDGEAIKSVSGYERLVRLQLDPLKEEDVRDILGHRLGKGADSFFEEAHRKMLHGLLDNPLTLEMLVKAMDPGGEWPESRVEVFERACTALATDVNHEHRAAARYKGSPSRVLDIASHVAALYLLAGKDGIAWDRSDVVDSDNVLLVNETLSCDADLTRRAWESALFAPRPSNPDTHRPVHEHVAEYLAARHLNKVLSGIATLERVLSLLTVGGGIPSPLIGVAAWLAALCRDARRPLVDLDPMGVVAYGDISVFDDDEKAHLLDRLSAHPGSSSELWNLPDTPLAGLVDPRTMDDLQDYMAGNDRSETVQDAMILLLRGVAAAPLRCGDQVSGKDLLATVRDATWSLPVRHLALDAALKLPDGHGDIIMRLRVLEDVVAGKVDDPSGNIQESLFRSLYPECIPPEETWRLIPMPIPPMLAIDLPRRLSPEHSRALLDALHIRSSQADHVWDWALDRLAWELLAIVIEVYGKSVGVAKLYDWIKVAAYDSTTHEWSRGHGDADYLRRTALTDNRGDPDDVLSGVFRVQAWLAKRPSIQKDLLLHHLLHQDCGNDRHAHRARIFGATAFWRIISRTGGPGDFEKWCLRKALAMSTTNDDAADWLIMCAVAPIRRSMPADEWLPTGLEWIGNDSIFTERLKAMARHDRVDWHRKLKYSTQRTDEERQLASLVLEHRGALIEGTGPEGLLIRLGQIYLNDFNMKPVDGTVLLRTALASNEDATDVALNALVRVPTSEAGPDISEIMKLDGTRRFYSWAMPFLAGLDVMEHRRDNVPDALGEGLERAIWFCLITPLGAREMPAWFARVLKSNPEIVAQVIVKLHRNRIRSKHDGDGLLQRMALDRRYRYAAQLALPELLKAFPAKGYGSQLPLLRSALVAAIHYVPEEVVPRVRNRMAIRNMNAAQRITWLGAGVAFAPDEFVSDVVAFVEDGRSARRKHLVDVLHAVRNACSNPPLFDALTEAEATAVGSLVSALGRRCTPSWSGFPAGTVRLIDKASTLVEHMIECLSKNPTREAGLGLELLSGDSDLGDWHALLDMALKRQKELHYRTEHNRNTPTVEEVEEVLRDGPPANAADLAALVVDRLQRLGRDIRQSSTDDWQPYWNEGKGKKTERRPPWPKDENTCRNALLSAVGRRLPDGVDARREASYAENARADIRVCFSPHAIPIEIKKSGHREVWSAMRNQLMKKYVRDPESAGYGIYVVLWFGAGGPEPVKTPPKGPRPKDPEELARRLEEELSDDERHRVKVVVIDVSRPEST